MAELEKLEIEGLAQSEVIVIPIIDVSGSMAGERIASVNEAMSEVPAQLASINDEALDTKLLIAPMEFSSGARWFGLKNNEPAEVESFRWIDMKASGLTDLGAACKLLCDKLTTTDKGGWMKGRGGSAPVIILISDGGPTDNYKPALEELKRRGWFRVALKFAVAVEGADKAVLAEFTGHDEAVIDTAKIRLDLASIVKKVVVSASQSASQTASSSNKSNNSSEVTNDSSDDANEKAQQEAIDAVNVNLDDADLF